MGDRGTAWIGTWYPPTDSMDEVQSKREIEEYAKRQLPPGWSLQGQMEQCPESKRYHYQFMLKTPQVRFSAVVKQTDKAHIELAKNKAAVEKYVRKEESRIATIEAGQAIPSIFEYQGMVAKKWRNERYLEMCKQLPREDINEVAMLYLDSLVAEDIASGMRGPEWIATNPMWRNAWKKFWRVIIEREHGTRTQGSEEGSGQTSEEGSSPAQPGDSSE